MRLEDLKKEVEVLTKELSLDDESLTEYINMALIEATRMVRIPSLKRIGTVDTNVSQAYVSISSVGTETFAGYVTKAVRSDGTILAIKADLEEVMETYPTLDEEGSVACIAVEGDNMYYQPIPETSDTITFVCYVDPPLLISNDDVASCIPSHLHYKLLGKGAAYYVFSIIEEGLDYDQKLNTVDMHYHSFSEDNKESGIVKLREWIAMNRRHKLRSYWSV